MTHALRPSRAQPAAPRPRLAAPAAAQAALCATSLLCAAALCPCGALAAPAAGAAPAPAARGPKSGGKAAAPKALADLKALPGNPNLLESGLPKVPREFDELARRYGSYRSALLLDTSTDGARLLISTRFGSTAQLHLVEHPLGQRVQLTFGEEPIAAARFLPQDPNVIFYLQDAGGGEFFQLYRLDARTQKRDLLTDGKSRHESLLVSHEGRKLAYSGTGRNGKDSDVYVADTDAPAQAKRVTDAAGTWRPLDFSPSGKQLLVVQERSIADADLWSIALETGEKRQLTPKDGKASVRAAAFSADGRAVYCATDRYSNFNELVRIELDAKPGDAPRRLTSSIPWDVQEIAVAHDTGAPVQVAVAVDQDGYDRVYLVEPGTSQLEPVALPTGVVTGLHFAGRKNDLLSFSVSTAESPADVFQLDVRTRKLVRWTQSELGPIDASALIAPALVHYPSTDNVNVPAFVYRPAGDSDEKRPALIIWHGGPESQARPSFNPFAELLAVELGLTVVVPNVRGSDGYGKQYLAMDNGVKREQALNDIGATLDWVREQPGIDPARIGIYGGSYGGYMTLATAAFHPGAIKAAVDIVGISNLVTFLERTQPYRRDLRRAEYGDERVPEVRAVLERISPLNKASQIRAALLVVQGKNDPRVPRSESEQIVRAVRGSGHEAWYLLGLNEGHGFQKKENRDAMNAAVLYFLREKLIGPARAR
ncbi:MAG TPA: alpha/beta fold hydrolase [Myxococcales bacterium]|jgi:dipeptidyl aminopeptidase/acylaminoacyl peptidase|nr:alpha/beta fold hydrolase [Myxococcales bacterium]